MSRLVVPGGMSVLSATHCQSVVPVMTRDLACFNMVAGLSSVAELCILTTSSHPSGPTSFDLNLAEKVTDLPAKSGEMVKR